MPQNLTLSIHVLYVHKVVSKIKMKTFQDCKIKHDWDKNVASKVSLEHKGHKYYHQKSTGKCSQPTIDGKSKR
jgi:hypothetical protein